MRRIKERLDDEEQLYPLLLFEFHLGKVSGSDVNMPKIPPGWNKKINMRSKENDPKKKLPPPSNTMINASDIKKAREGFRPAKKTVAKKPAADATKTEPVVKPEPATYQAPAPAQPIKQPPPEEESQIKTEPNIADATPFSPKREDSTSRHSQSSDEA